MKNTELKEANTYQSTVLLKRHLKAKFGIYFSVRTEKYAGGSSLNIKYVCGPDKKLVEQEVSQLSQGSFNGMEDIYEFENKGDMIIEGYIIEKQKYVFVEQEIPSDFEFELAKKMDQSIKFTDVPELTDEKQMGEQFTARFGSAWNWTQLFRSNFKKRNFITNNVRDIDIVSCEPDPDDNSNFIFIYKFEGKVYTTQEHGVCFEEEPIQEEKSNNNNVKKTAMKTVKFQTGQDVKVTYKKGTTLEGEITKVTDKAISVKTDDGKTVPVQFNPNTTIEIMPVVFSDSDETEAKEEKAPVKEKAATDKKAEKAEMKVVKDDKTEKGSTDKGEQKTGKKGRKKREVHPLLQEMDAVSSDKELKDVLKRVNELKNAKFIHVRTGHEVDVKEYKDGQVVKVDKENGKEYSGSAKHSSRYMKLLVD